METSPALEAASLVSQVISTWRSGSSPDACEILERHPDLCEQHSLVLDLAYEEYCLRREAGERVLLSTFCERFPTVRKSLRVLLAAHECTEEDAESTQSLADTSWPEIGSRFLGFQLMQEIGRGAFARVYLATEPALGNRLVVVKVSPWGGCEAETLGRLTHRNIVPVYSVQQDESSHLTAVCMPYLGRSTLLNVLDAASTNEVSPRHAEMICDVARRDAILDAIPATYTEPDRYLQRTTFVDGIVHIAAQLADALAHAHDAGICHRDLKPSNILLAPAGCPLLLDFNLSSDERLQRTLVGGTLPYMPPEQLRSVVTEELEEESLGDPRSDIFSMGVILYELLASRLPFGDQSPSEEAAVSAARILDQQKAGCEPLSAINQLVDPQLALLVHQCLQLQPEHRIQSAQELASLLRARLTRAARLRHWASRRKFLLATSTAGLGIFAASIGLGLASRPPYAVRRYLAGVRACEANDFQQAVQCFTDAHNAEPDAYQPLFARGQALVALGKYQDATQDMEEVHEKAPDGLTAAWFAYSAQLSGDTIPPIHYYCQALQEYGYETPAILNNLAYAHRLRGFNPDAIDCLTRAVELDPNCQEAYLNRATIYSEYSREFAPDGRSYREMAIEDAEQAVKLHPDSSLAHYMAAKLHFMHNHSSDRDEKILSHLHRALDCGFDRDQLLHRSGFDSRYTDPLADYAVNVRPVPTQRRLLAPPNSFRPWIPGQKTRDVTALRAGITTGAHDGVLSR